MLESKPVVIAHLKIGGRTWAGSVPGPTEPLKSTKGTKDFSSVPFVLFVAKKALRCDAEDAPQSVVELEGRLRTVEVITRDLTRSACAVHWNYVHVI